MLLQALAISGVLTACITDTKARRVPNWLTLPLLLSGLGIGLISSGLPGFLGALYGATVAIGVFVFPFAMGWLGGGDVKLFAALGSLLGISSFWWIALYSAMAGGVISLAVVVYRQVQAKEFWKQVKIGLSAAYYWITSIPNLPRTTRMGVPILPSTRKALREKHPYAIAIALGTLITLIQGKA